MSKENKLPTLVIPKGRLYDGIAKLFLEKGIELPSKDSRAYFFPKYFGDCNLFIAKPKSVPQLINSGLCEFGFCGRDIVADSDYSDNNFVTDKINLIYDININTINIVIASKNEELVTKLNKPLIIATEYPIMASKVFTMKGIPHYIISTGGSTEGYTHIGADCILDVCETGETLIANGLHINESVMVSSTCLFGHVTLCDCVLPNCLQEIIEFCSETKQVYEYASRS